MNRVVDATHVLVSASFVPLAPKIDGLDGVATLSFNHLVRLR